MAEERIVFTAQQAGSVLAVMHNVEQKMTNLENRQKRSVKHAKGLVGEFEKIPRRLIVAGGAAMAFSLSMGTVTKVIGDWNTKLDQSRDKLKEMNKSILDFLAMVPQEGRVPARQALQREALISPLNIEDIGQIRAQVQSILPPSTGISQAVRETLVEAAKKTQLLRGIPGAPLAGAVGKAYRLMPGAGAEGWANMFNVLLTEAGFSGEELSQFMAQTTKAISPGAATGIDPAFLMALLAQISVKKGEPERAAMGVGMGLQKLYKPGMARKMRIPRRRWAGMGFEERLGAIIERGGGLEEYQEIFGERVGSRMYAMIGTEAGRGELAVSEELMRGAIGRPGLDVGRAYEATMAGDPQFRAAMTQAKAAEFETLKALHPARVTAATARERRRAFYESMSGAGWTGWLDKKGMQAMYGLQRGYGALWPVGFGGRSAEEVATERMVGYAAGAQRVMDPFGGAGTAAEVWRRWESTGAGGPAPSGMSILGHGEPGVPPQAAQRNVDIKLGDE